MKETHQYRVVGLRQDGDFHLASGSEIPVTRIYTAHSEQEARKKAEKDGLFGGRALGLQVIKIEEATSTK